ncbi:MAG: proline--tRNA ligase, partial [Oscillospiraceae bacterium]|nr:proline--tRNA ligase [Oscillospiraceae bacterium]
FGDGFAKAFDITYTGRDNKLHHPHETSWGMSTRIIGAIIMTHGDDNGLVLPPAIAPWQAVIVPIAQHKPGVLDAANELKARLAKVCRVKMDDSDNAPGWKFAEYEMKGVPLRIELGPKDIENGQCVVVTRHNREKHFVKLDEIESMIPVLLQKVRDGIYQIALENRENRTFVGHSMEEIMKFSAEQSGFLKTMWCGELECEMKMKEEAGLTSRCMPFEQENLGDVCPICGKPAKTMVVWGKAY